jgi:tetratricopeptide (TPR) repeat protein
MSSVSHISKLIFGFALAIGLSAAQQQDPPAAAQDDQKQRDLKVEKLPEKPPAPPPAGAIAGKPVLPRGYAVIIGVAQYQNLDSKHQLAYAERDADSIYSILISPEGGNFRAEDVHKLIGPKATLANIKHELEVWLAQKAQPEDRVLIYFAGHGFLVPSNGRAFLAPYDFKLDDPSGTGYPMDALASTIQNSIKARSKILLTDSCHSGAIAPDAAMQEINHKLANLDQSVFSLTASRDRERSFESPNWGGGHGIFTYYVVQGMQGAADESGDGYVTVDELADYVRRNVREATNGQQNPTSERGSFDPNMQIAYVPSHIKPEKPPAKDGGLVFESNMDNVEIFLDGTSIGTVNKSKPLSMPGLAPGPHTVKGVRMGYEADGPREEVVYPGRDTTVTIRILIPRHRPVAAVEQLDEGIKYYTRGKPENYKKAIECFNSALAQDPTYSEAALYLGRAHEALFDTDKAAAAFKKAIEIDPDYQDARTAYATVLLDTGNLDDAVRQLNEVVTRDKKNGQAWYLLSQALCRKEAYDQAIEAANTAIALMPYNGEGHLWLAESLHLTHSWDRAITEYNQYLKLTNFDSGVMGQLNYNLLGYLIGMGKKSRSSLQDIWKDARAQAYFGLCDCERHMKQYETAIAHCQKSLSYSPNDALTHYVLGMTYALEANQKNSIELASVARQHFQEMLAINPDLNESSNAKAMIANIDQAIKAVQ